MPKITEMFCFAMYDQGEDDEGIIGWGGFPLVGADMDRAKSLEDVAQVVANIQGKQIRLYRFSRRTLVKVIEPKEPHDTA